MTSRFGGGMEYPGLVLVGTTEEGGAVVHEVAHQWWYGIVGNDEYTSPWLDESFAQYANARFYGWETRDCWSDVYWPDDSTVLTDSMGYWSQHRGDYHLLYTAGPCALADLERTLGAGDHGPGPQAVRPGSLVRRLHHGCLQEGRTGGDGQGPRPVLGNPPHPVTVHPGACRVAGCGADEVGPQDRPCDAPADRSTRCIPGTGSAEVQGDRARGPGTVQQSEQNMRREGGVSGGAGPPGSAGERCT